MSEAKGGRGVFIGNIPYGLTEEDILRICSTVGQVLSFRLVCDSDTGKPKGYGFAEFSDADAAASAVRNLNNHDVGGRLLRVDYSHVGSKEDSTATASAAPSYISAPPNNPPNPILGPLPMGAELPAGLTCPDAISKTLSTLPPPQLLDILSQMKSLVTSDPNRAAELLRQAPQLSYAIFQALLLMGLVDASLIAQVVEQSSAPPAPAAAPAGMPARPFTQPPTQYAPPAPPPQYAPPTQQQPAFPPGQEQLIRQLLAMPQSEIDRLGPAERSQVMALRQQFGGRV